MGLKFIERLIFVSKFCYIFYYIRKLYQLYPLLMGFFVFTQIQCYNWYNIEIVSTFFRFYQKLKDIFVLNFSALKLVNKLYVN